MANSRSLVDGEPDREAQIRGFSSYCWGRTIDRSWRLRRHDEPAAADREWWGIGGGGGHWHYGGYRRRQSSGRSGRRRRGNRSINQVTVSSSNLGDRALIKFRLSAAATALAGPLLTAGIAAAGPANAHDEGKQGQKPRLHADWSSSWAGYYTPSAVNVAPVPAYAPSPVYYVPPAPPAPVYVSPAQPTINVLIPVP